ncbi:hypothetical protein PWT90_07244 [Aphanocladium album]|nr:hypothetical protein PWT90_07244 [Aphanocladium album]
MVSSLRRTAHDLLSSLLLLAHLFMGWKALSYVSNSPAPIAVVTSESMEPGFQRGDVLFLWNRQETVEVGDVALVAFATRRLPMVRSTIDPTAAVFAPPDANEKSQWFAAAVCADECVGSQYIRTKGDNVPIDDASLYPNEEGLATRENVIGQDCAGHDELAGERPRREAKAAPRQKTAHVCIGKHDDAVPKMAPAPIPVIADVIGGVVGGAIGGGATLCARYCPGPKVRELAAEIAARNLPPGVSQHAIGECTGQINDQKKQGKSVEISSKTKDTVDVNNVPPACMSLATVLTDHPSKEGSPIPIPMGSDSLQYRGISAEDRQNLAHALGQ